MKRILLTQGKHAIVDDEDFEWLNQFKWWFGKPGYAQRTVWKGSKIYMHRVVMKVNKGINIDHINGDKLDNRKVNLRLCNQSQNMANAIKKNSAYSKYKGVSWNKNRNRWVAQITVNYKHTNLGSFLNEKEAAKKYNEFAIKEFGKFAKLNEL